MPFDPTKLPRPTSPFEDSMKEDIEFLNPEEFHGLTGGISGTSNLSNEEIMRRERFYAVDAHSPSFSFLGKQPDAGNLSKKAVIGVHQETGAFRVVNNPTTTTDTDLLSRFQNILPIPRLKPNSHAEQAARLRMLVERDAKEARQLLRASEGTATAGTGIYRAITKGSKVLKGI